METANGAYFQTKIQLSGLLCISGWLAVPVNPDKWNSTLNQCEDRGKHEMTLKF